MKKFEIVFFQFLLVSAHHTGKLHVQNDQVIENTCNAEYSVEIRITNLKHL